NLRLALAATYLELSDYDAAAKQMKAFQEEGSTKHDDGSISGTITLEQFQTQMMLLGNIERGRGEYEIAEYHYKVALGIAESANNRIGMAVPLLHLAMVYDFQGEYKQAQE